MNSTKSMYEEHHQEHRSEGFSILKEERGKLIAERVGKGKRVLDLGCRDGALTTFFVEGNKVLGVDVDEVSLARAHTALGIDTKVLDAHGDWHELQDDMFDVIVAGEILEHLFYPSKVIQHVCDHLNPGGMFIGSVPNAFSLKNRLRYLMARKEHTPLADPTHINHFSARDLRKMLDDVFQEVHIVGLGRHNWLAALLPNWCAFDLVFIAEKHHSVVG